MEFGRSGPVDSSRRSRRTRSELRARRKPREGAAGHPGALEATMIAALQVFKSVWNGSLRTAEYLAAPLRAPANRGVAMLQRLQNQRNAQLGQQAAPRQPAPRRQIAAPAPPALPGAASDWQTHWAGD